MKSLGQKYKVLFKNKHFLNSLALGAIFLPISIVINMFTSMYATDRATAPVGDIILSNIPVFQVDHIFIYGPIIFWTVMGLYALSKPEKIPFWLKAICLFVITRSIFISLTHIGPFPDAVIVDAPSIFSRLNLFIFNSGGDLFFSAHTGLPFLNALVFWENRRVRIFCILSAIFFGVIVLLGHLHYSIDVLSAFFITFTIHHIATRVFSNDLKARPNLVTLPS